MDFHAHMDRNEVTGLPSSYAPCHSHAGPFAAAAAVAAFVHTVLR
jgi:hypothetical protein